MANQLVKFDNPEFGKVRALLIDGNPWFVGKDVAQALGYVNPRKALKDHVDDEDKKDGVTIRDSIGREQKPVLINESGLYSLILSSKLESARRFKRWVTSEVLPSIRKTGSYSQPQLQRDARWIETRKIGKSMRKAFTGYIKLLEEYLAARGRVYPKGFLYAHLTNVIQRALKIDKGSRDFQSAKKLNQLDQAEDISGNVIINGIASNSFCTLADVEAQILAQLRKLNDLICGSLFIPAPITDSDLSC